MDTLQAKIDEWKRLELGPKDLHKYVNLQDVQAQMAITSRQAEELRQMKSDMRAATTEIALLKADMDKARESAEKLYERKCDLKDELDSLKQMNLLERMKFVFKGAKLFEQPKPSAPADDQEEKK